MEQNFQKECCQSESFAKKLIFAFVNRHMFKRIKPYLIAGGTRCPLAEKVEIFVVLKSPLTIPGTTNDGKMMESCCRDLSFY